MPTYEYECATCGKNFDVFQSMSDLPLNACPTCGKAVRRRINGGTGIIFKGSGFYKNDSRKASSSSVASPSGSGVAGQNAAGQGPGASNPKPACESCSAAPACDTAKKEAV